MTEPISTIKPTPSLFPIRYEFPTNLLSAKALIRFLVRKNLMALFRAAFLAIMMNLVFQVTPALLGIAINHGISRHQWIFIWEITLLLLTLALIGTWSFRLRERYESLIRLNIFNSLVNGIMEKSLSLGSTLLKESSTGLSVSIGMEDTNRLSTKIPKVTSYIATAFFSLINCFFIMLRMDTLSAMISMVSMIFFIVLSFLLFRILQCREHDFLAESATLTSLAGDIVLGLRILGGIGGQNIFAKNYIRQSHRTRQVNIKQGRWISVISAIANVGPMFVAVIMIYLAGKSVIAGTMPLGNFIILTAYIGILSWAVWAFIEVFYELMGLWVSAQRIVNLLNIKPEFTDPAFPIATPQWASALYDPVHDIRIRPGESLAIISAHPRVADKICYDLAYYRAESPCLWGNIPFGQLSLADIRSHIILSDQDDYLFSASLGENILLGRPVAKQIVDHIIAATCCDEIIEILDQGWETQLFDDARNLSVGQRQRVRLARALAAHSEYLFLLDPTSAVDAQVERVLAQNILSFRRAITEFAASTVFASSSPAIAAACDEVIFIDKNEKIYRGTHQTLLHNPEYSSAISRPAHDHRDHAEQSK